MDRTNLLPDHILTEIFGNLSPRMIKSCALVCKRWDEIIGTSKELMGRFKLDLNTNFDYWKIQEAKELQRKYQTLIVNTLDDSLDVISRHNLQSLKIHCSDNTKLSTLIEALNSLTALKVFEDYYNKFDDDLSESSNSLKKVKINIEELQCSVQLLQIFDCCTVKKLKSWIDQFDDNTKKLTLNFLKRQRNLEDFSLNERDPKGFFTLPDIYELKFCLKMFKYSNSRFLHYEAFIKFLDQHKKSLTSLKLSFGTQFGIELIHKFALENIANLKHLRLGYFVDDDINKKLSYNELPAATAITRNLVSLTVDAQSTDMNEDGRFYDMFPNLKHLVFNVSDENNILLLCCISERCVNVEKLSTYFLDSEDEIPFTIYFPKLKEFNVCSFHNEENLCAFINRHSETLEKIVLGINASITHLTAKEILNCPNLNYLELSSFKSMFSVVRMLDKISLKTKSFTLKVPYFESPFKFPDDKAIWDEKTEKQFNKMSSTFFHIF